MKKTRTMFLLLAALAVAPACSKKDDDAKNGAVTAKAGDPTPKAAPAPAKASTIDALKLAYDGPAGNAMDMAGATMVTTDSGMVFSVEPVDKAPTLDEAVESAKDYSPTITKQEKTADGYDLEFNNSGSMGANYFVEIVRTIGGKAYKCTTTGNTADQAAAVVKVCQSLRAQ